MPYIRSASKRGGRMIAGALGALALVAAPAHAAATPPTPPAPPAPGHGIANPYNCAPQPTLAQTSPTWSDNDPLHAGPQRRPRERRHRLDARRRRERRRGQRAVAASAAPTDRYSLDLPAGSSAVTAPLCIDETYPHFRLFARNAGLTKASLKIEVLYFDAKGKLLNTKPYNYTSATTSLGPDRPDRHQRLHPQDDGQRRPGRVPLHPAGNDAHLQIDDVYVDPYSRW